MTKVGFVGAGAAASATAYELEARLPDVETTIVEKSRGVCGRAATRRRNEVTYDYGANYVKADDERVNALLTERLDTDGLVDVTEPIWTFDREGTISPGRDADDHKWSYRAGLTQIAKRLLARTDATIHRGSRVERIERHERTWTLADTEGHEYGPFDVLVLNPPAPQTATLLEDAAWDDPLRAELAAAVADVPYRSVWTAVLGYDRELEWPYYALVNADKDHELGWIAREECKPGHVPDGESVLVVQAGGEWSREHYDEQPEANVTALADHTADLVEDDRLREPTWTDHQGWRYALPEAGVDREPLASAKAHDLYCVGDWVAGEGRLHAALRNGLETGETIASSLENRY
ncbi:NAD(P)/FAD-dependent oxidoreductase [Natrialbaceae archaeon A-gly3]